MQACKNTAYWGKKVHSFKELPSTHSFALDKLSKSRPSEGLVILAGFQTEGRGQIDKYWESQRDANLLMSTILYPTFVETTKLFWLNIMTSMALLEFFESHSIKNVEIKWPNDILIKGKKMAGILIQNSLGSKHVQSSVLSIGLNVNQVEWKGDFNASSMSLECGYELNLQSVFEGLCVRLERTYENLKMGQINRLLADYNTHLFGKNNRVLIMESSKHHSCKLIRIESNGDIVTQDQNGEYESFSLDRVDKMIYY